MPNATNLISKRFGRLTVIERSGSAKWGPRWLCKCDCGNDHTCYAIHLVRGSTNSCGCLHKENQRRSVTKHGLRIDTEFKREYRSWTAMRSRCNNSGHHAYSSYGGRGIKVCPQWDDFTIFLRDMGRRPLNTSLERKINDFDYTPDNCIWATPKQQMNNRRANVLLTCNCVTKTISQWGDYSGINRKLIAQRIRKGWPVYDAIFAPPGCRIKS